MSESMTEPLDEPMTDLMTDLMTGPKTGQIDGWRSLRRAVMTMRPDPWRILFAVLLGSAALSASIALMGTAGWLISRAAQQPPVLYLMVAVVAVRAFGIGRGVLRYAERLVSHDVALRGVTQLRTTLFSRLAAADDSAVAVLRRGDLLARIGADADVLSDVVVRSLLPFGTAVLTCAAGVTAVTLILPAAGAVLAAGLLIGLAAAPALAGLAARRAIMDTAQQRSLMSTQVLALLDGVQELTVAGAVPGRIAALDRSDRELSRALDAAARPAAWAAALSTGAMAAAMLGCLIAGTRAVSDGRLAPVMLAVLSFVPLAMVEVVAGLPAAASGLVRAQASAIRIVALLDCPPARAHPIVTGATTPLPADGPAGHLAAEGLACGWPGRAPVVRGLDLDLSPGRRIAIVGPSGEGKTTLLRTLAGLLPSAGGRVTLDGIPLADLDPPGLRRVVSFTADDAFVFTTSVRENVRAAAPGATDDVVLDALRRAGLGDWVQSLRAGMDTIVADPSGPGRETQAHLLSGGERRRLLMARALVSGARVLLVDEPSEHLDPATADAILAELFGGSATAVVVTHRLAPLARADEVLVLSGGRVAARGTHDWLVANHPPYRQAWAAETAVVVA